MEDQDRIKAMMEALRSALGDTAGLPFIIINGPVIIGSDLAATTAIRLTQKDKPPPLKVI